MTNELTIYNQNSGVLARIGTPEERRYLIELMAEQIGIPRDDATRTDVIALLAAAAQRTIQYGWSPGIHMHVQKFETKNSRNARKSNPQAKPVYSYSLVDGEKAWKDSGKRWRDRGVNWRYQRKPMTQAELRDEARLMGYTDVLPGNAFGMWSRILIIGRDDPANDFDPMWSAGVYLGKIRVGNYWNDDTLPTGVSARDVAWRRADKRAMMQSELSLLPVDDLSPDQRISQLVDNLRHEADNRTRTEAPLVERELAQIEDDGDMIFTAVEGSFRPVADPAEESLDFDGGIIAEPGPEDDPAWPESSVDDPDARIGDPGTRIVNSSDKPCPDCHAPAGKPHATSCPSASDARIESPDARIDKPRTVIDIFYERLLGARREDFDPQTAEVIRKIRNAHKDSAMPMSEKYLHGLLTALIEESSVSDEAQAIYVLCLLTGIRIVDATRPGQLVHGYVIKRLREKDADLLKAIIAISTFAENTIATVMEEGTHEQQELPLG